MLNVADVQFDDQQDTAPPPAQKPLKLSDVQFDDEPAPKQAPIKMSDVQFEDAPKPAATETMDPKFSGAYQQAQPAAPQSAWQKGRELGKQIQQQPQPQSPFNAANRPGTQKPVAPPQRTLDDLLDQPQAETTGHQVSSITNRPTQSLAERAGGQANLDAAKARFEQQQAIHDTVFQNALNAPPEQKKAAIRELAKLGPLEENEQKALGIDSHYLQSLMDPLFARSEEIAGGVARLGGKIGIPGAQSGYEYLKNAAEEDRLRGNISGVRGYTGDTLGTIGELVPDLTLARAVPGGGVASEAYWPAVGMAGAAGRGGNSEDIIKAGLSNVTPIAGARLFRGAPLLGRVAANVALNEVTAGMAGGAKDLHSILTTGIMAGAIGWHGKPGSVEELQAKTTPEDIARAEKIGNDTNVVRAAQEFATTKSPESEAALKTAMINAGMDPRQATATMQSVKESAPSMTPESVPTMESLPPGHEDDLARIDMKHAKGQPLDDADRKTLAIEAVRQPAAPESTTPESLPADRRAEPRGEDRRQTTGEPPAGTPERRDITARSEERKIPDEMTDAEIRAAYTTSNRMDLPNQEAFRNDERKMAESHPHISYADLDDFKPMNEAKGLGHEGVDRVALPGVGEMFKRAVAEEPPGTIKVYHRSGDEFYARSSDPEAMGRVVDRVNKELTASRFVYEDMDGNIRTANGTGLSYGTADSTDAAEAAAARDKQRRKDEGLRKGARDTPDAVGAERPAGEQATQDNLPGREDGPRQPPAQETVKPKLQRTDEGRQSAIERIRARQLERQKANEPVPEVKQPEVKQPPIKAADVKFDEPAKPEPAKRSEPTKEPWQMTAKEFDEHYLRETPKLLAAEMDRKIGPLKIDSERLQGEMVRDPGNPANASIRRKIQENDSAIAAMEARKTEPLRRPSEKLSPAQMAAQQGITQAIKEGKEIPPEVLREHPELQQPESGTSRSRKPVDPDAPLKLVNPKSVNSPGHGMLAGAKQAIELAKKQVDKLQTRLSNATARDNKGSIRMDLTVAKGKLQEARTMEAEARAKIESDANRQGLTTKRPRPPKAEHEDRSISEFARRPNDTNRGFKADADLGGELNRLRAKESGTTGLFTKNGLSPDRMLEAMKESHFLEEDATISDMMSAIEDDLAGKKTYSKYRDQNIIDKGLDADYERHQQSQDATEAFQRESKLVEAELKDPDSELGKAFDSAVDDGAQQLRSEGARHGLTPETIDNLIQRATDIKENGIEAADFQESGSQERESTPEQIPSELTRLADKIKGKSYEAAKRIIANQVGSVKPGEKFSDDVADAIFKKLQRVSQRSPYATEEEIGKLGRDAKRLTGKEPMTVYRGTGRAELRPGDFVAGTAGEARNYTHGGKSVREFSFPKEDFIAVKGSMGGDQEYVYLPKGYEPPAPIEHYGTLKDFHDAANRPEATPEDFQRDIDRAEAAGKLETEKNKAKAKIENDKELLRIGMKTGRKNVVEKTTVAPKDTKTPDMFDTQIELPTASSGEQNTLFTKEGADEALDRILNPDKNLRRSGPITTEELKDWLYVAGYHIERGVRTFADFSRQMILEIGDEVKPHLRELFNKAHEELGETPEPEPRVTGIKNSQVDLEREARGAPPIEKLARKSFGTSYDQGRAIVDNDPEAYRQSVKELTTKPRVLTDAESAALIYDRMRLQNEQASLEEQIAEAQKSGNEEAQISLNGQLDAVKQHIENNDFAADRTGTHAGRALAIRRMMIREDYSLDNLMRRAKIANDGQPVPEKTAVRLKELSETIKRTSEDLAKQDEIDAQRAADRAVKKIDDEVKTAARRTRRTVTKAKLDNDFDSLKAEFKNLFKSKEPPSKGLGGPEAGAVVGLTLPAEAVTLLTKMARNRIEAGMVKAVDIVDSIYSDVKDALPDGFTYRDIRDAISGSGKTSRPSKDAIDTELRKIKRELRDVSAEEDIVAGKRPPRSGYQPDPPTAEERARTQRLNQLKREHGIKIEGSERSPEQQQKSALDGVKTRLKNAIQDLDRQIKTGEKPPQRTPVPLDAEAKALQAERDSLRATLDAINGPRRMTDAQRIEMAQRSLEKSITEYDRRISDKDFTAKAKADPVTNLQLEALKQRRDAAKKTYQALKDADPAAIAKKQASQNEALRKRLVKRQAELEEMLRTGNFEKTPKAKLPLTAENVKLQNENRAATREVQQIIKRMNEGIGAKVLRAASDVINAPKSLLTSIDISAGGRQGLVQVFAHPKIAAEAFIKQFQAMSEVGQTRVYDEIQKMPFFGEAKKAGLYFAGDPLQSAGREEAFLSKLPEKIPYIGRLYAGSERAYSAFLDWQRIRAYQVESQLMKSDKAGGYTPEKNPEAFQQLAKFINRTTGRGDLGEGWYPHEAKVATGVANLFLFSPRYMASRFQMLNGLASKNPAMRRIAGRTLGLYYGGVVTALGLAAAAGLKVSTDPDDPDFLKVRAGNTSYDLTRGQNQDMRVAFQLVRGLSNNARGIENTQAQQPGNVALHYLRGKTAPALGTAIDYKMGSNIVGDKFTWKGAAANMVAPMVGRDLYEGYKDSGAPGFVKTLPTVIGIGTQTYKRTPQEIRDVQSLATKFKQANRIPMDTFSGGASELTQLKRSLETADLPTAESEIKRLLGELRGTKPGIDDRLEARTKIKKAIDEWAGFHAGTEKAEYADAGFRPLFTGSATNEAKFKQSLTPAQRETYGRAVTARKEAWQRFTKLLQGTH